jgi:hypothetical protein
MLLFYIYVYMGINVLLFKVIDFKDRWIQYILILTSTLYLMFSYPIYSFIKKFNKTAMIVYNKRELKNSILVEEALSLKQIS